MLSKCSFTKGASTNIHNLSAGCNSGEYGGRNSQNIPVGTGTFALRCHPAISWTNRIIFSAVASSNAAKVFNTRFNHCVFTLGIKYQGVFPVFGSTKPYTYNYWYRDYTTDIGLSPTGDRTFFIWVLIRLDVHQKTRLILRIGDILLSDFLLLTVPFI